MRESLALNDWMQLTHSSTRASTGHLTRCGIKRTHLVLSKPPEEAAKSISPPAASLPGVVWGSPSLFIPSTDQLGKFSVRRKNWIRTGRGASLPWCCLPRSAGALLLHLIRTWLGSSLPYERGLPSGASAQTPRTQGEICGVWRWWAEGVGWRRRRWGETAETLLILHISS